jgi:hypothetical protein
MIKWRQLGVDPMNVQMDFVSDWQEINIRQMQAEGLRFSTTTPRDLLMIRYLNYERKKGGDPYPRNVHFSKEFACPPVVQNGLNQLVNVIKTGQDISPYLSTRVERINYLDGMFNDWEVLHLHLGEQAAPRDPRFIERTNELLFLILKQNDAFLINVFDHNVNWTNKSILQTVHNNWPTLIEPFILQGAIGLEQSYTMEEHFELRKAGITVMMELTDTSGDTFVIAPPGLGITTSGDSVKDVRIYHNDIRRIRMIEQWARDNIAKIVPSGVAVPDPIRLKLVLDANNWLIEEQSTGHQCKLP